MPGRGGRNSLHCIRTAGLLALLGLTLQSLCRDSSSQSRIPRVKHAFTLRGVSDRLPFGTIGDICFEPRYREIYLTDTDRDEVWVMDSEGFLLFRFGREVGLRDPRSIAVFPDGRILVSHHSESGAGIARVFNARGRPLGFFPPLAFETAHAAFPAGVEAETPEWAAPRFEDDLIARRGEMPEDAFARRQRPLQGQSVGRTIGRIQLGPDNTAYAVDAEAGRILVYGPDGTRQREIGEFTKTADRYGRTQRIAASGLAVRRDGTVLASDLARGTVVVYGPDGTETLTIGRRGGGDGLLSFPVDVAADPYGNVYVVDRHRHTILVYEPVGRFLYEFGGLGDRDGYFFYPTSICMDDVDRLWITDMSKRVQVFQIPRNGNGTGHLNGNGLSRYEPGSNGKERMVKR